MCRTSLFRYIRDEASALIEADIINTASQDLISFDFDLSESENYHSDGLLNQLADVGLQVPVPSSEVELLCEVENNKLRYVAVVYQLVEFERSLKVGK